MYYNDLPTYTGKFSCGQDWNLVSIGAVSLSRVDTMQLNARACRHLCKHGANRLHSSIKCPEWRRMTA